MNEDFEKDIKLFPVKKLLSSLGYTVVEKDDTQCIIYDNQENGVGTVSILDDIKFEIDGVGMRVFGHYDYNKAFDCIKRNINPQWDVKFAIDGANVNHSYIQGDLTLTWKNNQHDSDEPDYRANLQLKVTNNCYDKEVIVDMMNNGNLFGIQNLINHEGETDDLKINNHPDYFNMYASHKMMRLSPEGPKPYKATQFALWLDKEKEKADKGLYYKYDVLKTFHQNMDDPSTPYINVFPKVGDDSSQEHLDNLDYIIGLVHPEMINVIQDFSDNLSSSNYRILDKLAGLTYPMFCHYTIEHLTGLQKEELKIYGPKAETK